MGATSKVASNLISCLTSCPDVGMPHCALQKASQCLPSYVCPSTCSHMYVTGGSWQACLRRACFESMVIRTILPGADRSIVGFGPSCDRITLHSCDLGGVSGLLVPKTKVCGQLTYGIQCWCSCRRVHRMKCGCLIDTATPPACL